MIKANFLLLGKFREDWQKKAKSPISFPLLWRHLANINNKTNKILKKKLIIAILGRILKIDNALRIGIFYEVF